MVGHLEGGLSELRQVDRREDEVAGELGVAPGTADGLDLDAKKFQAEVVLFFEEGAQLSADFVKIAFGELGRGVTGGLLAETAQAGSDGYRDDGTAALSCEARGEIIGRWRDGGAGCRLGWQGRALLANDSSPGRGCVGLGSRDRRVIDGGVEGEGRWFAIGR